MLKTTLLLTSILCAGAASAATYSFNNNYSNLTDAGLGFNDSFDLNSFISNTIPVGSQIDIYSATLGFSAYSSSNSTYDSRITGSYYDHTEVQRHTDTYRCGFSVCTDTYYTSQAIYGTTYAVTNGDHEVDRVQISSYPVFLTGNTYQPSTTSYSSGYLSQTTYNTGRSSGYVSDSNALNSTGLTVLNDNHILNYNVDVTSGHFNNLSVSLQISYNVVDAPAPVPLPASVLLMGAALGGLSLTRRRKKQAA